MLMILRALAVLLMLAGILILFPAWFQNPPTSAPLGPPGQSRASEPFLSGWGDARLKRLGDESNLEFASRITQTVYQTTYHCEANEARQTWAAQMAASHAWEISTYGYLDPSIVRCGYCHQRAFILAEALRRGGIEDAQAYALNEHVVTLFGTEGRNYIADSDFGMGPVVYDGSTYAGIPDTLYADHVDAGTLTILKRAFAQTTDDSPYMSHEWLMTVAARQAHDVREVERKLRLWGNASLYGGTALLVIFLVLPRRRVSR